MPCSGDLCDLAMWSTVLEGPSGEPTSTGHTILMYKSGDYISRDKIYISRQKGCSSFTLLCIVSIENTKPSKHFFKKYTRNHVIYSVPGKRFWDRYTGESITLIHLTGIFIGYIVFLYSFNVSISWLWYLIAYILELFHITPTLLIYAWNTIWLMYRSYFTQRVIHWGIK